MTKYSDDYLAEAVHRCAYEADNEIQFYDLLRREGIPFETVWDDEELTMVTYRVQDATTGEWFEGYQLGSDLALPALRARWNGEPIPQPQPQSTDAPEPSAATAVATPAGARRADAKKPAKKSWLSSHDGGVLILSAVALTIVAIIVTVALINRHNSPTSTPSGVQISSPTSSDSPTSSNGLDVPTSTVTTTATQTATATATVTQTQTRERTQTDTATATVTQTVTAQPTQQPQTTQNTNPAQPTQPSEPTQTSVPTTAPTNVPTP